MYRSEVAATNEYLRSRNHALEQTNRVQRERIDLLLRALEWKFCFLLLGVIVVDGWKRIGRFVFILVAAVVALVAILLGVMGLVLSHSRVVMAVNTYSDAGARCICCAYGVPNPPRSSLLPYEPRFDAN